MAVSTRGAFCRTACMLMVVCIGWQFVPAPRAQDADDEQIDIEIIEAVPTVPVPDDFTVRARIVKITPAEPSRIAWRHGGEGAGGDRIIGTFVRAERPEASGVGGKIESLSADDAEVIPVGRFIVPIAAAQGGPPNDQFPGFARGNIFILGVNQSYLAQGVDFFCEFARHFSDTKCRISSRGQACFSRAECI